jgi:3-oxoacyl-ACP reductase-like protein
MNQRNNMASTDAHQYHHQERLNMNKLAGKVAIVTGASKGIGAAIAAGLAEAGVLAKEPGPRKIRINAILPDGFR